MEKKCKNKKCQKILPEGYKYSYCENCRNQHANTTMNVFKGVGGAALAVGSIVIAIVSGGHITPSGKA